jgi:hypothetical protein
MRLPKKRATLLLYLVAVAALASSAVARPIHRHHTAEAARLATATSGDWDQRNLFLAPQALGTKAVRHSRHVRRTGGGLTQARSAAQSHSNSAYGGFTTWHQSDLALEPVVRRFHEHGAQAHRP